MTEAAKDIVIRLFKEDKITFNELLTIMGLVELNPFSNIPKYKDPIINPLNPNRPLDPLPSPWPKHPFDQVIYCTPPSSEGTGRLNIIDARNFFTTSN